MRNLSPQGRRKGKRFEPKLATVSERFTRGKRWSHSHAYVFFLGVFCDMGRNGALGMSLNSLFCPEELCLIDRHILETSHNVRNQANLTVEVLADWISEEFDKDLSSRAASNLLKELDYDYRKLKSGYYLQKSEQPWVRAHRAHVVPLLQVSEHLQGNPSLTRLRFPVFSRL